MAVWGCLSRRERWGLTLRGWVLVVVGFCAGTFGGVTSIHAFLTPYDPVACEVLVVEGWVHDQGLRQALQVFRDRQCQVLVTTGGPIPQGRHLTPFQNYAGLAAATLEQLGLDMTRLQAVPTEKVRKDRTYETAVSFKAWLQHENPAVRSINILTVGAHARRSRLLFATVLGDDIRVGVIPVPVSTYDVNQWWTSSSGVRTVLGELIAYLYARWFFYPEPQ